MPECQYKMLGPQSFNRICKRTKFQEKKVRKRMVAMINAKNLLGINNYRENIRKPSDIILLKIL